MIMLRNITPKNIFVSKNNRLKLIDFGYSKQVSFIGCNNSQKYGDIIYTAPEILKGANN